MKLPKKNIPYVLGHRGAAGYYPENTLLSFSKALEMGADGVELDVQMSADGELIIMHDETLDRTTDGHGFVKDMTFEELRKLNAAVKHPEAGYCQIPTLKEVLQLIRDNHKIVNIEIKSGVFDYPGIVDKVMALVREMEMEDSVIYSSFNHYSCLRVHELDPDAYVGLLYADRFIDTEEYVKKHGGNALHPAIYFLLNPETVRKAAELGLDINVWTVDEIPHLHMACQMHLTTIITNYPDRALSVVTQYTK